MSWLCVAKKKPPPPAALETCDCSHLNLVELPREVLDHMKAIRSLNLNSNAVKDIPKVRNSSYFGGWAVQMVLWGSRGC